MNVWFTNSNSQNEKEIQNLKNNGINIFTESLLDISESENLEQVMNDLSIEAYNLLIFTSQNAINIFCKYIKKRDITIFVAGNTSANLAKIYGFKEIIQLENKGAKPILNEIIKSYSDRKILYVTGMPHYLDFSNELKKLSISCDNVLVYKAVKRKKFSSKLISLLNDKYFHVIVLLSSNAARCFEDNVMPMIKGKIGTKFLVISKKIANELKYICQEQILILENNDDVINFLIQQSKNER